MWKALFDVAKTTALVMTITADEKAGLLNVTVTPRPTAKDAPPALSQPLSLKATPEELDAGFVETLTTYGTAYASLKETVEAAVAVMNEAKKALVSKVAAKAAKAAPARQVASASAASTAEVADQDEEGDDADDDEASTNAGTEAASTTPPPDTRTINLFA